MKSFFPLIVSGILTASLAHATWTCTATRADYRRDSSGTYNNIRYSEDTNVALSKTTRGAMAGYQAAMLANTGLGISLNHSSLNIGLIENLQLITSINIYRKSDSNKASARSTFFLPNGDQSTIELSCANR